MHGRMKPAEKDEVMRQFVLNEAQIMVSTTVIEVGVNVPNASVMVIESAQRFGLSQLHQLRGRVGRGADQSYCVLITPYETSSDTRKRMEIMTGSNDGFVIAEADLKLRGPGDLEGTQQSGIPFDLRIADLVKDSNILFRAREIAEDLTEKDPTLEQPEHLVLKQQLDRLGGNRYEWGRIS
jgi:ATP-dependent DNA helicase RecG